MSNTRSLNMQKRRERILAQSRKVLAEQGFDALNLRDLAEMSEVTVPTIYNLIGNKEEVLKALMMGSFADFDAELSKHPGVSASKLPALMIATLMDLIARNEEFYRATALASERIENELGEGDNYGFKRVPLRKLAGSLYQQVREEGLLRGDIAPEMLIELVIANHQVAFRDWAHRVIPLQKLGELSLKGFYIAFAADATDAFRKKLVELLKTL